MIDSNMQIPHNVMVNFRTGLKFEPNQRQSSNFPTVYKIRLQSKIDLRYLNIET